MKSRSESFAQARRLVLVLTFLVANPAHANPIIYLPEESGSKVIIEGHNNIHRWQVEGKIISGELGLGRSFLPEPGPLTPRKAGAYIKASIPVGSLHGYEGLDDWMHRKLKEETAPEIVFQCDDLTLEAIAKDQRSAATFEVRGHLVVAGVTNQISLPLSVMPLEGDRLKITGRASLKMSHFGIEPPQITTSFGIIKYSDDVQVRIDWLLRRKP